MNVISDLMFRISNALLVPVIIGLIIFFVVSCLMIGWLIAFKRKDRQKQIRYRDLFKNLRTSAGIDALRVALNAQEARIPFEWVAKQLFESDAQERGFMIDSFELELERRLGVAKIVAKFGPILGLMGTLIPMGPALVGLSSGDIESMAYNMQVAFATTVLGMFTSGVGYLCLQIARRANSRDLIWLDYLDSALTKVASNEMRNDKIEN